MKEKKTFSVLFMAQAAMIAAIYVVVTLVFAPFSYGEVQVRLSEALTILPVFTPAAIPGLFIGCLISNILGGCIIPDIIFGSLATLLERSSHTCFASRTNSLRRCRRSYPIC